MNEILNAKAAFDILNSQMTEDVEEFWALALGPNKKLLRGKMLFRGTVDSCMVHPRDVFRFAYLANASSLIIAHNHPSQDKIPSPEDIELTNRLIYVGKLLEVPVIDHLLITRHDFFSFAAHRVCNFGFTSARTRGRARKRFEIL